MVPKAEEGQTVSKGRRRKPQDTQPCGQQPARVVKLCNERHPGDVKGQEARKLRSHDGGVLRTPTTGALMLRTGELMSNRASPPTRL